MTNPYKQYSADKNLESGEGVRLEYDGYSITIHRAGGGNRKYQSVFNARMAPHRRKYDMGTLAPDVQRKILAEVYAEAVIIGWDMKDEHDKPIEFTKENVVKVMTDLPDLFDDVVSSATDLKNFRVAGLEEDAKN